ncbi:MAG TPA: hypothetical protein VKH65_01640, partial [Myxococcales bacterium]|nr:hypothetical protein [Myxococcales bacterium]
MRALLAPGRGRGSSVSSLVCYLIGLSHIDPIAGGLALGRFLHEDLRGLPDIDLDFSREVREVLIPRVHERYGRDRAALVAAFPTYRARGAIRELGKVLGLPAGEIERLARGAEVYGHSPGHDVPLDAPPPAAWPREHHADSGTASPRWRWLARLVAEAQGLPRHLSQHPGGMIIATRPLIDCCPVVPAAMEGRQMVQWDKDSCADAGFLKIDLLGLGMLSAVERCVQEIARVRGERIDLSRIPFDDKRTFAAIRAADTVGVFQIESRAQMQSLRRTRPTNLADLTIQVAIIRPGPIQGGAINPYIERRRRLREDPAYEIPYEHPALRPILKDTLGTIIFQDQVMEVAEAFAGFSAGEADGLRRAMSRKRSQEMLRRHRERFLDGAMRHVGAERAVAERVWGMIEGFAGFGFPKAHSAAFGLLAYQSTWLRVHYGPEFLCALLNEQPMGFYAPDSLVHEAQLRGIRVLGLDVNASAEQCMVQGAGVRLGLGYIKDVAAGEVRRLVAERERAGPFRSLGDLAARAGSARRASARVLRFLPAIAVAGTVLWGLAFTSIYRRPHPRVAAAKWIYENVPPPARFANESWDDALPLPLPGYDMGAYNGPQLTLFDPDSPRKVEDVVKVLKEADWIAVTSNRVYANLTRIPAVFPMSRAYYSALFEGRLGFDLAADFNSYPTLGPLKFPDDRAEEQFTVYDHPRVVLFRKNKQFAPERVTQILLASMRETPPTLGDWEKWPRSKRIVTSPIYPPHRAELEKTSGPGTREIAIGSFGAAILWYLAILLVGAVAFPLAHAFFPRLADRGAGVSRILG